MLAWLYGCRLGDNGIRFVLFGFWTVHVLKFEKIASVREVGRAALGPWNAYNFKSRVFSRAFLIETKSGWFARNVLVTPKSANEFLSAISENGIPVA